MKSPGSRLRLGLLAGAILLVASSMAIAATRTKTTVLPGDGASQATVRCPHGQHVKLFGYEGKFDPRGNAESALPTQLLRPRASTVAAGAGNLSSVDGTFKTIASCGAAPAMTTQSAVAQLASREQRSVVAQCPHGSSVRLGGFTESVDQSGMIVAVNGLERQSARTLQVSGLNIGTMTGQLGAYAYCAKGSPSVDVVKKTANLADEEERTVVAKCPRAEKLLMGGFEVQHYEAGQGDIYVVGMSPAGRRGWSVTGQKVLPLDGKLTSIAYCH